MVFCPTIYLAALKVYKKLADSGSGQIKGMVSIRRLILSYIMQQVTANISTKFQNPRCSCSWEIFDTNFPMYYIGMRDGKKQKWKKKAKLISASWFSFPQYTWPLLMCIQNLKTLAFIEAEKPVTEFFIGEKENGQIMGQISRRRLILSYTVQQVIPNISTKFQNPRFNSSWKIFDEINVYTQPPPAHTHTHTHKHCYWKDKNYIPPIYFVYRGYNKRINKYQQPDSSIHDTSTYCPCLEQKFNFEKRNMKFLFFENWRDRKMEKLREKVGGIWFSFT